jgi:RNA ligase
MFYEFPFITHIDDVLPAIEGCKEFVVSDKGSYKVVNYVVSTSTTFPECTDINSAIRRECRGLIFDSEGNLISRRHHKFFNISERPETSIDKIDLTQEHVLLEKLDGSMVSGCIIEGEVVWMTKMGCTPIIDDMKPFLNVNPQYENFVLTCARNNKTPIFEWCSPFNRIVIDYPEPRLVLTAVRDTFSGQYVPYSDMLEIGDIYDIEIVRVFESDKAIEYLLEEVRNLTNMEGYVIRFANGHSVKCKGEWYVRLHKTKELFAHDRHLAILILTETADDAKSFMLPKDREKFEKFEKSFVDSLEKITNRIYERLLAFSERTSETRKQFAMSEAKSYGAFASIVFKHFDDDHIEYGDIFGSVEDLVTRNAGSNTNYDRFVSEMVDFLAKS